VFIDEIDAVGRKREGTGFNRAQEEMTKTAFPDVRSERTVSYKKRIETFRARKKRNPFSNGKWPENWTLK
jgi:ATP-dependent 26S proteasome regulatory subunit